MKWRTVGTACFDVRTEIQPWNALLILFSKEIQPWNASLILFSKENQPWNALLILFSKVIQPWNALLILFSKETVHETVPANKTLEMFFVPDASPFINNFYLCNQKFGLNFRFPWKSIKRECRENRQQSRCCKLFQRDEQHFATVSEW